MLGNVASIYSKDPVITPKFNNYMIICINLQLDCISIMWSQFQETPLSVEAEGNIPCGIIRDPVGSRQGSRGLPGSIAVQLQR